MGIDVAYFGPESYVQAQKRANAEALVVEVDIESGVPGYRGIIITKKDSGLNSLESIIGSLKGNSFIEKLSEVWSGKGERMLIILHYFIEHLESKDIKEINKSNLKLLVSNFSIPTKIKMKHFFVIKKKDEILFKEWIESNFNDEDAKMLFENLSNAKVFIKEELNYLNRFWI